MTSLPISTPAVDISCGLCKRVLNSGHGHPGDCPVSGTGKHYVTMEPQFSRLSAYQSSDGDSK